MLQNKCCIQRAVHRSISSNTGQGKRCIASFWPLPSFPQLIAWMKPSPGLHAKNRKSKKVVDANCQHDTNYVLFSHSFLPIFSPCACLRSQVLLSFEDSYICQSCHILHPFMQSAKAKAGATDACSISAVCYLIFHKGKRGNEREKEKGRTVASFNKWVERALFCCDGFHQTCPAR